MNSIQQKLLISLQRTKKTDKRIRVLIRLAEAFNRENGARSLAYAQEALQLAKETGDRNAFIECHTLIADAHFFLGNYSASLEVYDEACFPFLKANMSSKRGYENTFSILMPGGNLPEPDREAIF